MVFVFGSQLVFAKSRPSLIVTPSSLTKNVGDSFDLTVKVKPNGKKVCAVEGQLLLSKLNVQRINVASGIISQTPPSFSNNLHFLLGIPKCTTSEKSLFTVRVKANSIPQAVASFRKVDAIGKGKSISSTSHGGSYKIVVPKVVPKGKVLSAESMENSKACNCEKWNDWQDKGCGQGECLDTQMEQVRNRTCQPAGCDVEKQYQCVNNHDCIATAKTPKTNQSKVNQPKNNSLLSALSNILTLGTNKTWVGILVGIVILVLIISFVWWKKKKKL